MSSLIYAYSRAQAIEDGFLVDVTETAREAGFTFPVALSRAVWATYVEVPPRVTCQDEAGRLWDILIMLRLAIEQLGGDGDCISFNLHVRNNNRPGTPPLIRLRATCGPGDHMEPVITVMLPNED